MSHVTGGTNHVTKFDTGDFRDSNGWINSMCNDNGCLRSS